ncbi:MAG: translation initiation factor IF-2 associated domain-containing protein, partial [Nitrosospira sp.]|nr:translation initiation factor IF-2 associated domain-containing protein [Nitrosospira sp.]
MPPMNVEQFASELGVLPAVLLEQLRAAGVSKHLTEDSLTEKDKTQLLEYLRKIHGSRGEKSKISLPPRRQTSEIKKSDSTGKPRSIQVEVRKKRVLLKDDSSDRLALRAGAAEPAAPAVQPAPSPAPRPVVDAAQQALREEEARKQAELIARQTAELKEKQRRKLGTPESREQEPEAEPAVPGAVATSATPTAAPEAAPAESAAAPGVQAGAGTGTPQAQPASTEGTLHKPVVNAEDKAAKAEKKKKQTKQVVWKDERVEKRGLKTRGDLTGGKGWRTRRD